MAGVFGLFLSADELDQVCQALDSQGIALPLQVAAARRRSIRPEPANSSPSSSQFNGTSGNISATQRTARPRPVPSTPLRLTEAKTRSKSVPLPETSSARAFEGLYDSSTLNLRLGQTNTPAGPSITANPTRPALTSTPAWLPPVSSAPVPSALPLVPSPPPSRDDTEIHSEIHSTFQLSQLDPSGCLEPTPGQLRSPTKDAWD